jgi:hypothetical protein
MWQWRRQTGVRRQCATDNALFAVWRGWQTP